MMEARCLRIRRESLCPGEGVPVIRSLNTAARAMQLLGMVIAFALVRLFYPHDHSKDPDV